VDAVTAYLFPTPLPPPPPVGIVNFVSTGGTIETETDSNDWFNMPSGGEQALGQSGGSGQTGLSTTTGYATSDTNINFLSSSAYGNLNGRMDLSGDIFSHQSKFSILGQKKPVSIPSVMRGASDSANLKVSHGVASHNDNGFTLPPSGNHPSEEGSVFHRAEMQTVVSVPTDAISEEIALSALVTCGNGTTSGNAVLSVIIECVDTGAKLSRTVHIPANTIRKNIDLFPTNNLNGANTPSNRIKVTIKRRNVAEDTATDTSVVLHSVDLQFKRAGMQSRSETNKFRPYE
jgi:hypothetical protein